MTRRTDESIDQVDKEIVSDADRREASEETDGQEERQIDICLNTQKGRSTNAQAGKKAKRPMNTQTQRQTNKCTSRQIGRPTNAQVDR